MYLWKYLCICIYIIYVYMCMYIYMYLNICIYKCISLYVNIHIRMYDLNISIYLSIYLSIYPPIPADSRGSASEKRGQEGQEARGRTAMVFWPWGGSLTGAAQDESQLQEERKQVGSWQCRKASKLKVWS